MQFKIVFLEKLGIDIACEGTYSKDGRTLKVGRTSYGSAKEFTSLYGNDIDISIERETTKNNVKSSKINVTDNGLNYSLATWEWPETFHENDIVRKIDIKTPEGEKYLMVRPGYSAFDILKVEYNPRGGQIYYSFACSLATADTFESSLVMLFNNHIPTCSYCQNGSVIGDYKPLDGANFAELFKDLIDSRYGETGMEEVFKAAFPTFFYKSFIETLQRISNGTYSERFKADISESREKARNYLNKKFSNLPQEQKADLLFAHAVLKDGLRKMEETIAAVNDENARPQFIAERDNYVATNQSTK